MTKKLIPGRYFNQQTGNEAPTTPQVLPAGPEVAVAAAPKNLPTLTLEQKMQLLTLQRNAVLAQNQKFQADQVFDKAMAELNRAYAAVNTHQGFSLHELTLDFVETQ